MNYLIELVKNVPKAAALVGPDEHILDCNSKLRALAGDLRQKAVGQLAEEPHLARLRKLFSLNKPGWRGDEITLNFSGKSALCWCEIHSLVIDGQLVHFLEIMDVERFHTLEAAYLHQLRRVMDDNLWVLDEAGDLVWVRTNNQVLQSFLGRDSAALILESDRQLWKRTLSLAQNNPGQTQEVQIRAAADGAGRYIDLCYLDGSPMGGRFYVASRSTVPTGSRIILRLKEAWTVSTDDDLAKQLGTKKSAISRANAEESVPPVWLVKTGQLTGFSLDWLLTGQGEKRRI